MEREINVCSVSEQFLPAAAESPRNRSVILQHNEKYVFGLCPQFLAHSAQTPE